MNIQLNLASTIDDKKMIRKAINSILPMLSAWAVVMYIHGVQYLYIWKYVTKIIWLPFFFIPVICIEIFITRYFMRYRLKTNDIKSNHGFIIFYIGNILLWIIFYLLWAVFVALVSKSTPAFQLYGTSFFLFSILLWRSMYWEGILAVFLWILLYYLVTIRWNRFRILTSVLPYFVFTGAFCVQLWLVGGIGAATGDEVEKQAGVHKVFDIRKLERIITSDSLARYKVLRPREMNFITNEPIKAINQVREIFYKPDENALFLFYGATYLRQIVYPGVVRLDLSTGETKYRLTDSNIRQVTIMDDGVFLAQWHDPNIYELSTKDLSVKRAIPYQISVPMDIWEVMAVMKDLDKPRIYISTTLYPVLISYDMESEKLLNIIDISAMGLVIEGGAMGDLMQSRKTRKLYMGLGPGASGLLEVDPDTLRLLRWMPSFDYLGPWGYVMDDDAQLIYLQCMYKNDLYKVDIKDFKITRKYKGEAAARCLTCDKSRNVVYVLGYFSGKLFPIDLETGKRLWEIKVGGRPHGMDLKGDTLWVHSMAGAFKLDLNTIWRDKGFEDTRYDLGS